MLMVASTVFAIEVVKDTLVGHLTEYPHHITWCISLGLHVLLKGCCEEICTEYMHSIWKMGSYITLLEHYTSLVELYGEVLITSKV